MLYQLSYAPETTRLFARRDVSPTGDEGTRTPDPLLAKQMLYQLSYIPALPLD